MPRIAVINPNRSPWMTQRVGDALATALGVPAQWHMVTASGGPDVIDSVATFNHAAQALGREARHCLQPNERPDAIVLACFGDPGLEGLRADPELPPVVGLAHAAMAQAAAQGERFAVLTCGPDWKPLLTQRAGQFGLAEQLVGVWALPVNGAAFANDPDSWWPHLMRDAHAAAHAGATSLILGGAVFAGLAPPPAPAGSRWLDAVDACANALQAVLGIPAARR
ncbi:MAG: Asp/Glu racemase [Hydrogenophaga sp.]|nr:Asp/Glu racemase [Hydrogenophaga sp.]